MNSATPNNSALSTKHLALVADLGDRMARRWVSFGRLLRRNGVACTAGQMRDLLAALPLLDLSDRDGVYYASRALLCSRRDELPKFDLVFRQFWGRTRQIIIPSDTGSLDDAPASSSRAPEGAEESVPQRSSLPMVERSTLTDSDNVGGERG